MGAPKVDTRNRRLNIRELLKEMMATEFISKEEGNKLLHKRTPISLHPLIFIARQNLKDSKPPNLPITLEGLLRWLANYSNFSYYEIDPLKIDINSITKILPKAYLKRLSVIPVEVKDDSVVFATAEPFDLSWTDEVSKVIKKKVEIVVSNPIHISNFIEEFFTVRRALREYNIENKKSGGFEQTKELEKMLGSVSKPTKEDSVISNIVDWLFKFAFDERATDIHLEPRRGVGQVRFRIDGTMRVVYKFDPEIMLPIISRIKILGDMKVDEKRRPQDGRIKREVGQDIVMELRLSTIPTHYGEKLVIRIFDPNMADVTLADIGMSPRDVDLWKNMVTRSHGMVLVTGPTGSGKSTTLHASLRHVATEGVNVCTVEDPVEIINDSFSQMQVNRDIDITFGSAIRSFLRQDPDVIMVGEIRDMDAGTMAIQAALTGHMVYSTVHTNDAASTITRLLDLGIPSYLITACLRCILAQRLVRLLCKFCKKKVDTPKEAWDQLVGPIEISAPPSVYTRSGCTECKQTGYMGRACVYELLPVTRELNDLIRKKATLEELTDYVSSNQDFVPMRENGVEKVIQGLTSIEEVLRVIV
ncbi:MAG: type II/IV secretion system protein [Halobacteriovoraceae bacterium]|jgi:general secretion pathway protein E|nr:type II/IV secretion system protein [Halobacteriovoraceae bacterium]MBT5093667.1 type II/IV secretion system protein [Halobacteriovoraceae bacterium]